jgi:hypothetical protein
MRVRRLNNRQAAEVQLPFRPEPVRVKLERRENSDAPWNATDQNQHSVCGNAQSRYRTPRTQARR